MGHADIGRLDDVALGIFQIETPSAVAEVEAIAAVRGADVLFVGPADLSHSLGVPGRFDDPLYLDALRAVVDACARNGKAAGILLHDPAVTERHLDMGFRFVGLGSDGALLGMGARTMLGAASRP